MSAMNSSGVLVHVHVVVAAWILLLASAVTASIATKHGRDGSGVGSSDEAATVDVQPWGWNTVRVRVTAAGASFNDAVPNALVGKAFGPTPSMANTLGANTVVSGDLQVAPDPQNNELLVFSRVSDGAVLFRETNRTIPRSSAALNNRSSACGVAFSADADDQVFGLGQGVPLIPYPTLRVGPLNRKGVEVAFDECVANEGGAANCLPWATTVRNSSVQFGFLWNVPSFGGVKFGATSTEWWSDAAWQLDYVVSVPNASDTGRTRFDTLHNQYSSMIGRAFPLPTSLLGYWHSKNAYRNQTQVLDAMAGFREREIPVDVFIIDIGGSRGKVQGDWAFNPAQFPDPSAMAATLAETNTRLMVSVWAGTGIGSTSWQTLVDNGLVVKNTSSAANFTNMSPIPWPIGCSGPDCFLYDASNPAAREYVWQRVVDGYVKHNISLFWLDASEPQPPVIAVPLNEQYWWGEYQAGRVYEVGMAFTQWHTTTFRSGFERSGLTESVVLARSGWFGSAANGAALWSGDTLSDWTTLQKSIMTGLGAQITGIALWTTDVGGYRLWNISDMPNPELVVRWFQFGLTCPLLRQHGHRPETVPWAYGPVAGAIIADIIRQRAALRPYLRRAHDELAETGRPFNRPMWWDYPDEAAAWDADVQDTQYMFGPDYLAAPVVWEGRRWRNVYLPAGDGASAETWQHVYTNETFTGGQTYNVSAPLDQFPLFRRL